MSPRTAIAISLVSLALSGVNASITALTIRGADEAVEMALRWKAIADQQRETTEAWRMVARLYADDLAICNSMLPREKRL